MSNQKSPRFVLRTACVRWLAPQFAVASLLAVVQSIAVAQGLTTAAIRGQIRSPDHIPVDAARVHIVHDATGFATWVETWRGRFHIQGLEPGGPYTVVVRAVGFAPQRRAGLVLALGEVMDIHVVLEPLAVELQRVTVVPADVLSTRPTDSHGGTATLVDATLLRDLPTLNRDMYDFVRLVPQISTKIGTANTGFSAGGMGFRFNNFLINGVSERSLSGVSVANAGARSLPLDAVQEYQVLLAPYDVRYGDFAGGLVNTVTKSGSNVLTGSVFAYARNDHLARGGTAGVPSYDRIQYGFALGGPIVRNRVHFFVAPELQRFTFPAVGPYVGQSSDAEPPLQVRAADLSRLDSIMQTYGLIAGSSGPVENSNPLKNLFARVDVALPVWRSRATIWANHATSDALEFSRARPDTFSLSSYQFTRRLVTTTHAVQLHTALPRAGGGHNEFLLSFRPFNLDNVGPVQQPIVRVAAPSISGGRVTLNTGTHEAAQGLKFRAAQAALRNDLTLPIGAAHTVTVGVEAERFRVRRGVAASYGTWVFSSLDAFASGTADRYERALNPIGASPTLRGGQYGAYVGDQWEAGTRTSITVGMRADALILDEHPPYNAIVDSIFGRRTDQLPRRRVELSPRVGFIRALSGSRRHVLRGGAGIFAGRIPLSWFNAALWSHGTAGLLRCGGLAVDLGPPPPFVPDYRPTACGNDSTLTEAHRGDVDLLDPDLRMLRVARASMAYDRRLPRGFTMTTELLVTHSLSDVVFVNLNLKDPTATDRFGRVVYDSITTAGIAISDPKSDFSEVIDLRNTSRNHSHQITMRLEKKVAGRTAGTVSYTYSSARDVQTPVRVNTRGVAVWASARAVSGRHDDLSAGISANDVPHRVVLAGRHTTHWFHAPTEFSMYYVGESGAPFTYLAFGTARRGDLNADGSNANDPVYVPRSTLDRDEIMFSAFSDSAGADNSATAQAERVRAQQVAFEQFIEGTPCLRRQRGRIAARNSCREPWSNTTIASVRQILPIGDRSLEAQMDVFNLLNLLRRSWGAYRVASPALLEHVGQTAAPAQLSQPIFRFDSSRPRWVTLPVESVFQLQVAVRYRF